MKKISTKQIGDGKLPNKYWVSISNDYYYFNEETKGWDWISDLKLFECKAKTIAVFDTYKEAKDIFESIFGEIDGITINSKVIEDRITGQLLEETKELYLETGYINRNSRGDLDFTIREMKKQGKLFV